MPGVSKRSRSAMRIHCLPRVTPALSPVCARLSPDKALIRVLLPVLGIPATITRMGILTPFSRLRARFSAKSALIAAFNAPKSFPPLIETATEENPCALKCACQERIAPSGTRSALFSTYKVGLPAKSAVCLRLMQALGQRASNTTTAPSQSFKFSSIMRRAFVIWPGNH